MKTAAIPLTHSINIFLVMKKKYVIYFIIFFGIASGCSSNKQEDSLPCIDITKSYPDKEIVLTDIADVTYLCLNSKNDEYLYKGVIHCVTKNTIVIMDNLSGKILFFGKDGNPKSQFNRKGSGPEEYVSSTRVIYDEENDDVFVYSFSLDVKVYSSTGEYKRKIIFPEEAIPNPIVPFDDESLFLYDASIQFVPDRKREVTEETDYPTKYYKSPFVRISKTDGKVLEYVELPINSIELKKGDNPLIRTYRIVICGKGLLLCNPETDTVFLYGKDYSLTPLICKTPLVKDLDPMFIMNNCMDYGGYQFIEIVREFSKQTYPITFPTKYLIRDKKTDEVFRQKIILPDYNGKEFFISTGASGRYYEDGTYFDLDLVELKQALNENRLNGKLKELVNTLDEEKDNNVFMFVHFK